MSFIITVMLWLLGLLLAAVVVAAVGLIIYARWNYGTLEKLGIPVIKPHWYLGSNWDAHTYVVHEQDYERCKKYGHVYGMYDGRQPTVCISDPEIVKLITVRDFESFKNHRTFLAENPIMSEVLDFLEDDKWKIVRSALTPNLTTGKIKVMSKVIAAKTEECVSALVKEMGEEKSMKMDFRQHSPPLILDIIGNCFCGIEIENPRDPNNKLIKSLKLVLGGEVGFTFDWTYAYAMSFPILQKLFPSFSDEGIIAFEKTMKGIFKGREDAGVQQQDMTNTLMEICRKSKTDPEYKRLGITETTALGQAFEFFVASYESVRGTLTQLTFYLATNPEVNKKLMDEVDTTLKKSGGVINYDSVQDMHYLSACISETLRIAPGFFRTDRLCTKDWEYNGIQIKKGMTVFMPLFALHFREEDFPEPQVFNPERFMPENKDKLNPYAFAVFGHGPRACIGQKFAYEMLKIVMTNYLKEFRIEKRSDTEFVPLIGNPLFVQYKPINVNFVRRN